jgi:hypothetical protein
LEALSKAGVSFDLLSEEQLERLGEQLDISALQKLSEAGFNLHAKGESILVGACGDNSLRGRKAVRWLCAQGANVHARGYAPFMAAIAAKDMRMVEILSDAVKSRSPEEVKSFQRQASQVLNRSLFENYMTGVPDAFQLVHRLLRIVSTVGEIPASHRLIRESVLNHIVPGDSSRNNEQWSKFTDSLVSTPSLPLSPLFALMLAADNAAQAITKGDSKLIVETRCALLTRSILDLYAAFEAKKGKRSQAVSHILEASRSLAHLGDSIRAVVSELYLPLWAFSHFDPTALRRLRDDEVRKISNAMECELVRALPLHYRIPDLVKLNRLLHAPVSIVPIHLRPFTAGLEWLILFTEPVTLSNGYSLTALGTQRQLEEEGDALRLCVGRGGYATLCSESGFQVFSLRRDGERAATITVAPGQIGSDVLIRTPFGKGYSLYEFRGDRNSAPTTEWQDALNEFASLWKGGQVEINPEVERQAVTPCSFVGHLSPLEARIGFPLDEPMIMDEILAHYRRLEEKLKLPLVLPEVIRAVTGH